MRIAAAALRLAQDDPRGDDHRPRAGPGRLRPGRLEVLAGRGFPVGGDRPGRARRPGRRRARPRARARSGRTRRGAVVVPAASRARPARAPRPAAHRARRPDRPDPRPAGREQARAPPAGRRAPLEPLTKSEIRVLRYLPTHLSAPEIARELSVSTTTVKTHLRNLYAKLGAHSRAEAVESARALGLLAPLRTPALTQRPFRVGGLRSSEIIRIVRWPCSSCRGSRRGSDQP